MPHEVGYSVVVTFTPPAILIVANPCHKYFGVAVRGFTGRGARLDVAIGFFFCGLGKLKLGLFAVLEVANLVYARVLPV